MSPSKTIKPISFVSTTRKILLILGAGIIASTAVIYALNDVYLDMLRQRISGFAFSFESSTIETLKNKSLDDEASGESAVNARLNLLKNVYTDTRFVYIMEKVDDKVIFLADSEPAGSISYSGRGDVYLEATDALKNIFINSRPFTEGPVEDEYGSWYSAVAPIVDDKGKIIAAIGMDVPSQSYMANILGLGVLPFFFAVAGSVAVYFYDISHRRRAEALRFQVELMSIASHELRTPLSGIRWGEETLLNGQLNELETKMLTSMYESTLRLQESIEDILQMAAMGAGKEKQLPKSKLNFSTLVQDVFTSQKLAAEQRLIGFTYDESWPKEMYVVGDATRLRRVVNNLVSNAIKYATANTSIIVTYAQHESFHIIRISNKGIGVPKEELARVFDGFYRASNAMKSSVSGTGMGLYMSRAVVEQHGGSLMLESIEDDTTTAVIKLPIATAPEQSIQATA